MGEEGKDIMDKIEIGQAALKTYNAEVDLGI